MAFGHGVTLRAFTISSTSPRERKGSRSLKAAISSSSGIFPNSPLGSIISKDSFIVRMISLIQRSRRSAERTSKLSCLGEPSVDDGLREEEGDRHSDEAESNSSSEDEACPSNEVEADRDSVELGATESSGAG